MLVQYVGTGPWERFGWYAGTGPWERNDLYAGTGPWERIDCLCILTESISLWSDTHWVKSVAFIALSYVMI